MEHLYGAELAKRTTVSWFESAMEGAQDGGPNEMTTFLLDCAPLLAKYNEAKAKVNPSHMVAHMVGPANDEQLQGLQDCENIFQEFQRLYFRPKQKAEIQSYCQICQGLLVVMTAEASVVCTVCGVSMYDGIPRMGGALPFDDTQKRLAQADKPFYYCPRTYFRKCLQERTGEHKGFIPPELWINLENNMKQHHTNVEQATPEIIRVALHRLKKPRYYFCRWYIARKFNPDLKLIEISHALMEQMLALFGGMTVRFPGIVRMLGLPRKNLPSYPTFAHDAFLFLHKPRLAAAFEKLKSPPRRHVQSLILKLVFCDLGRNLQKDEKLNSPHAPPKYYRRRAPLQSRRRKRKSPPKDEKPFKPNYQENRMLKRLKIRNKGYAPQIL